MSKLEEVGVRSRATADGDIDLRRRSPRLMKMKEASASLEAGILKLKEEQKALMDRREKRWDRQNGEIAARALKLGIKVDVPGKNCKVAEDLQPAGAAEVGQPAGARKKRKKVVKTIVPPALVEYMILNPHNPFVDFLEDNQGKTPTIQRSPTTRTAPRRTTVPMTRTTRSGIYVQDPAVRAICRCSYMQLNKEVELMKGCPYHHAILQTLDAFRIKI